MFSWRNCWANGQKSGINNNTNSKKDPKDFKVTYKYYLDGEEVNEMVKQDTIQVENPEFEGVMDKKIYTLMINTLALMK